MDFSAACDVDFKLRFQLKRHSQGFTINKLSDSPESHHASSQTIYRYLKSMDKTLLMTINLSLEYLHNYDVY